MKQKQVSIPEELFILITKYAFTENPNPSDLEEIRTGIKKKLDRMIEHDLYTNYKTSPTESQREAARKAYIEHRGIPNNFRW